MHQNEDGELTVSNQIGTSASSNLHHPTQCPPSSNPVTIKRVNLTSKPKNICKSPKMPRLPNSHYLEMKRIQIKTKSNEEHGLCRSMTPVKNFHDKIVTILQSTGK